MIRTIGDAITNYSDAWMGDGIGLSTGLDPTKGGRHLSFQVPAPAAAILHSSCPTWRYLSETVAPDPLFPNLLNPRKLHPSAYPLQLKESCQLFSELARLRSATNFLKPRSRGADLVGKYGLSELAPNYSGGWCWIES